MDTLRQDVLYAFRNLRKSPGYAAVTVLTLALGIGANSAIFSVVNGILLKPLPYPNSDRLLFITSQFPGLGFDQFWVSAPGSVSSRVNWRPRNGATPSTGINSAVTTAELTRRG